MNKISKIINLKKHPIKDLKNFATKCKKEIQKNSILVLRDFLNSSALETLQKESKKLHKNAFYCSQKHTVLLNKKNNKIDESDPCNIEVVSDKGCVPHDLIPKNSFLCQIYNSGEFKLFLKKILNIDNIYPYADTLSSINYNYYEQHQQLGWHFDNASFAITLMIQSSNSGGNFQYINKGRDIEKNIIDKKLIKAVLTNKYQGKEILVEPGTLILFYGRNYLHRVTPVKSKKNRILVTLNYNTEKGIKLSENARMTFFGRLN